MIIALKIFAVLLFIACYIIGGHGPKYVRRFVGSIGFGVLMILISLLNGTFGLFLALGASWYCPSLIIFKYGVNDGNVFRKVVLRGIYGASLGFAGLLISLSTGHLFLGVSQVILAAIASIFFGVINPFSKLGDKGVMLEDACIASGAICLVPFII